MTTTPKAETGKALTEAVEKMVGPNRYCIRCGGVDHIPEDDITCSICVQAIRDGTEPNGADRSRKSQSRSVTVVDVEEIASMLYEAANPTMRWSYLYPSYNHLHAAVRQRFLEAAARFQDALDATTQNPPPVSTAETATPSTKGSPDV